MVQMIDISQKPPHLRIATARGEIKLQRETIELIQAGKIKKGDPITIAGIAATLAIKKTPELIPLCHQIPISNVALSLTLSLNQEPQIWMSLIVPFAVH